MNLTISDQEKELLVQLLEQYIQGKLVEERHSFKRDYRTLVIEKENIAEKLLNKISAMQ